MADIWIGLLTDTQKRAGYAVYQDEDFVWLWHTKNGKADIIGVWLYETCRIKQVRDLAQQHMEEENAVS